MGVKKVVFIHIPKTAGRSVNAAIEGGNKKKKLDYVYLHGMQAVKNASESIEDGYTFTFVRDPWDRVVSNYYYAHTMYDALGEKRKTPLHEFRIEITKTKNFSGYVELLYNNWSNVKNLLHFFPQVGYVRPFQEHINYVGRYETISTDIEYVGREIGLSLVLPYENLSAERKLPYRDHYNEKTKSMVTELYADDIKYFGYGWKR